MGKFDMKKLLNLAPSFLQLRSMNVLIKKGNEKNFQLIYCTLYQYPL